GVHAGARAVAGKDAAGRGAARAPLAARGLAALRTLVRRRGDAGVVFSRRLERAPRPARAPVGRGSAAPHAPRARGATAAGRLRPPGARPGLRLRQALAGPARRPVLP